MSAHTPGPWTSGHFGTEALWIGPDHESVNVAVVPWDCAGARDEARANARLIAAAPELLAWCEQSLRDFDEDCGDPGCDECEAIRPLRALVAKATGAE